MDCSSIDIHLAVIHMVAISKPIYVYQYTYTQDTRNNTNLQYKFHALYWIFASIAHYTSKLISGIAFTLHQLYSSFQLKIGHQFQLICLWFNYCSAYGNQTDGCVNVYVDKWTRPVMISAHEVVCYICFADTPIDGITESHFRVCSLVNVIVWRS